MGQGGSRQGGSWLASSSAVTIGRPEEAMTLSERELLNIVRTNIPTSVKLGDSLGYTRVWATLPNKLIFWMMSQVLSTPGAQNRSVSGI